MSSLVEDVPEALAFCEAVSDDLDQYLLFPGEQIVSVVFGVLSTSGVDIRGDRFTPESLLTMERNIHDHPVWMMAEHNPTIQPIGRVIAAKSFYSASAKVHFLVGVIGYYGHDFPAFGDVGVDLNNISEAQIPAEVSLRPPGTHMQLAFSQHELEWQKVRDVLKNAPDLVDATPGLRFRKAAESIGILELAVTVWLLTQNPFSKGFLERLGTKSADAVSAAAKWVWTEVIQLVTSNPKITLFEVTAQFGTCRVEFVVPSRNRSDLESALESLGSASASALALVKRLEEFEPDKLVYEYDLKRGGWYPKHAATRKLGVISEAPEPIDVSKYKGLSAGGEYTTGK